MNNKVTVSAPGKLMLLGDHAVVHGNPCLVTAVNYRVFSEVSLSKKDEFIFPKKGKSSFVETALDVFREKFSIKESVRVVTRADYKESYGLGSSSAVTVSCIQALSKLCSVTLSEKELFDMCYDVVLKVQGVGSGFDVAAAIYGGTIYFITGGKKIERVTSDRLNLVVAYSGTKGDTATLVKQVTKLYEEKPDEINRLFSQSTDLVENGKRLLLDKKYKEFGSLMNENHSMLQKLGVSTTKLDELVSAARSAGALGAKLSGAGGGDCMIALVLPEERSSVETALRAAGGKILSVKPNEEGVRIE